MGLDFAIPLMGDFNQKNMRAAVAILRELGLSETQISTQMSACSAPPGRFEGIFEGQPFLVMVDYAHTPDSLANVLQTARRIADDRTGRLICVFGCGGDRDRGKRPEMGQEAAKYSDYFVVTADNPRSESQTQITADILAGLQTVTTPYVVLEDRESAIMHAVQNAKEHDVVVVAGKGHETYQILADKTIHFDDREMVRDAIRRVRPVSL
jgi:UDP-N-acetylmuramoyl-L-alanyl-D-glutamate--2,6-diaminopimelate ligase